MKVFLTSFLKPSLNCSSTVNVFLFELRFNVKAFWLPSPALLMCYTSSGPLNNSSPQISFFFFSKDYLFIWERASERVQAGGAAGRGRGRSRLPAEQGAPRRAQTLNQLSHPGAHYLFLERERKRARMLKREAEGERIWSRLHPECRVLHKARSHNPRTKIGVEIKSWTLTRLQSPGALTLWF